jgi:hypothetical protein
VSQECAQRRMWFCIIDINVFSAKITAERLLGERNVRLTLFELLVIQSNSARAVKTRIFYLWQFSEVTKAINYF